MPFGTLKPDTLCHELQFIILYYFEALVSAYKKTSPIVSGLSDIFEKPRALRCSEEVRTEAERPCSRWSGGFIDRW